MGDAAMVRLDTRPLRRSPAFRRLFLGQAISLLGTQISRVAVPLQVYAMTHSSLDVALIGLAGLLPLTLFGVYGGAIADRASRRRLVLICSTGSMLVSRTPAHGRDDRPADHGRTDARPDPMPGPIRSPPAQMRCAIGRVRG
ncbi:MAG: MFS transporter [Mycobacteriales bacterium]